MDRYSYPTHGGAQRGSRRQPAGPPPRRQGGRPPVSRTPSYGSESSSFTNREYACEFGYDPSDSEPGFEESFWSDSEFEPESAGEEFPPDRRSGRMPPRREPHAASGRPSGHGMPGPRPRGTDRRDLDPDYTRHPEFLGHSNPFGDDGYDSGADSDSISIDVRYPPPGHRGSGRGRQSGYITPDDPSMYGGDPYSTGGPANPGHGGRGRHGPPMHDDRHGHRSHGNHGRRQRSESFSSDPFVASMLAEDARFEREEEELRAQHRGGHPGYRQR